MRTGCSQAANDQARQADRAAAATTAWGERERERESCCNNAQVIRMPFFAKFYAEKLAECKNAKPKQKQNQRQKPKAKRNVTKRISLN